MPRTDPRRVTRREQPASTPDGMFTVAQAEELLGLRGGGLHAWLRRHPMQRRSCPRIGKHRFVPVQVLERYEAATNRTIDRAARRPAGYVGILRAAEIATSCPSSIWNAARRGELHAVRVGGIQYYNPEGCRRLAQQFAELPLPGYAQVLHAAQALGADPGTARKWLRDHGHTLRQYRRPEDRQRAWYAPQDALAAWAAQYQPSNQHRKLTLDDARNIRARRAAGEKRATLAQQYGVSEACIYQIMQGRTYQEVRNAAD